MKPVFGSDGQEICADARFRAHCGSDRSVITNARPTRIWRAIATPFPGLTIRMFSGERERERTDRPVRPLQNRHDVDGDFVEEAAFRSCWMGVRAVDYTGKATSEAAAPACQAASSRATDRKTTIDA